MKPLIAFFLGIGSAALLGAAVAQADGPRLLGRSFAPMAAPQVSGLSSAQEAQLLALREDAAAGRRAAHAAMGNLLSTAQAELARDDADLHALSREAEAVMFSIALDMRAQRGERLAFYDTLTPDQQSQVRNFLSGRMARLQRIHALVGDFLTQTP